MAFLPGLLASVIGSGALPSVIDTGAGLLKNLANTFLGARGGDIASKIIDPAAGIIKGLVGGAKAEPSAPALTAPPSMMAERRPIEHFASRMEYPNDMTTFDTTPAGRILLPDAKEAANMRTIVVPSPFMPRRLAGPRIAPHATQYEEELSEDPSASFRVLSLKSRMRHDNQSAPRPTDATTATEKVIAKKSRKKRANIPPASFKRYF